MTCHAGKLSRIPKIKLFYSRLKISILFLVFHCKILPTIDAAFKAFQSKTTDFSNTLKRLKICLEKLERYRHVNLKMEAKTVVEKWSITPEFS